MKFLLTFCFLGFFSIALANDQAMEKYGINTKTIKQDLMAINIDKAKLLKMVEDMQAAGKLNPKQADKMRSDIQKITPGQIEATKRQLVPELEKIILQQINRNQ